MAVILSPEVIGVVLAKAAKINPQMAATFAFGAFTGERRGQVLALRWSEPNPERLLLKIRRSISCTPATGMISELSI
ncbi:MAG: hypothetical protein EPN30_01565 [Actinomycetota bacterium]|nr:MAG: hypothetical protein EPN30_01565 [Actinomycetota bacterium]